MGEGVALVHFRGEFEKPRALDHVDLVKDEDLGPFDLRQPVEDRLALLVEPLAGVEKEAHGVRIRSSTPG
jgi:hypothetical protein